MTQFTVTAAFSKRSIALANLEFLTGEHMRDLIFKTWITDLDLHGFTLNVEPWHMLRKQVAPSILLPHSPQTIVPTY